ncbi:hypothetical protein CPB83DRAFT_903366 [Crepidotus variabilis]|uniref:Uncharacterized protein n=1 Tax=Crepidotus variabilis TaxID=179855 RepID=A0A9P6EQ50_9AGAR|nr:hypothetical protein CPB83DRAFT_903366 [Crepidotus variabilis]
MAVGVYYRAQSAVLLLFLIWSWVLPTEAGIVNRTIDDGFGDSQTGDKPIFLPATKVWDDQSCSGCAIRPDISSAFKNTYTAATYNPGLGSMSIELSFEGLAVWVYFILANNEGDGITSLTMANFTLDGGNPTLFQHAPVLTTQDINYNQLVYSQTGLVNAKHKLVISTSGVNSNVYVNFDYAIYTHDDDGVLDPSPPPGGLPSTLASAKPSSTNTTPKSTSSSSSIPVNKGSSTTGSSTAGPASSSGFSAPGSKLSNDDSTATQSSSTAGIVGGIVGGIAFAALLGFLFICIMRRQRRKARLEFTDKDWTAENGIDPVVTPFYHPTNGHASSHMGSGGPYLSNDHSRPYAYGGQHAQQHSNSQTTGPSSDVGAQSAYGGYMSAVGGSNSGEDTSESAHARLVTVTDGDHLSTPNQMRSVGPMVSGATAGSSVPTLWGAGMSAQQREDVRRERQRELDERMCQVQDEMNHLAADMTGQKPSRRRSIRRPQAPSSVTGEEEMSMEEMREQLRVMTNQVSYLRNQQQSAWALGLSDDPPPGYEPTILSSTNHTSLPPPPPPPHS